MRVVPLLALVACGSDPIPSSLLIVESEVALGQIFCGAGETGTLTIVNTGEAATQVAVAPTLPDVTVTPVFATIEPGEHLVFDVAVAMPRLGTPGFKSRGDLRVTTDDAELRVPLTHETAGVSVALESSRADFGELRPSSSSSAYAWFRTTNVGVELSNVVANVGYPSSSAFEVTSVSNSSVWLRLTGGPTPRRHEATLSVTVTGDHLCSPSQLALDLVGVVSTEPVLADQTTLDLGEIGPCESASASTTLQNVGPASDYVATLDDPRGWLVWGGATSGNVQGAKLSLQTPFASEHPEPGPYEARVTVAHASGSKVIPVRGFVHGHAATPRPEVIDLGDVPTGTTITRKVSVHNSGTRVASIDVVAVNAVVSPQAVQIEPDGARDLWVTYTAKNPPGTNIAGGVQIGFGNSCRAMERIDLRGRIVE